MLYMSSAGGVEYISEIIHGNTETKPHWAKRFLLNLLKTLMPYPARFKKDVPQQNLQHMIHGIITFVLFTLGGVVVILNVWFSNAQ